MCRFHVILTCEQLGSWAAELGRNNSIIDPRIWLLPPFKCGDTGKKSGGGKIKCKAFRLQRYIGSGPRVNQGDSCDTIDDTSRAVNEIFSGNFNLYLGNFPATVFSLMKVPSAKLPEIGKPVHNFNHRRAVFAMIFNAIASPQFRKNVHILWKFVDSSRYDTPWLPTPAVLFTFLRGNLSLLYVKMLSRGQQSWAEPSILHCTLHIHSEKNQFSCFNKSIVFKSPDFYLCKVLLRP